MKIFEKPIYVIRLFMPPIAGHNYIIGIEHYNDALSIRRARSGKAYHGPRSPSATGKKEGQEIEG